MRVGSVGTEQITPLLRSDSQRDRELPLVRTILAVPFRIIICHDASAQDDFAALGFLHHLRARIAERNNRDVMRAAGWAFGFLF